MILHLGERVACEACIRGHRAVDCGHLNKYLIEIKGRGRPGAKDLLLRFRIDPNPLVVRESMEDVENKNGRSKPGNKKRCYHLADDVKGSIYKVDLSNSFTVIGPATDDEIIQFESSESFKANFHKKHYKKIRKNRISKPERRRSSTESLESSITISRNSSVFSLNSDSSDINSLENDEILPTTTISDSYEDDYRSFAEHNVSGRSIDEIYHSFNPPFQFNQTYESVQYEQPDQNSIQYEIYYESKEDHLKHIEPQQTVHYTPEFEDSGWNDQF